MDDANHLTNNRMAARHAVQIDCDLSRKGNMTVSVRVSDLSASGARMTCYHPLTNGEPVWLKIAGFATINANTVWRKGDDYGVTFATPLSVRLVEEIAKAHPVPRHRLLQSDVPAGWSASMTNPTGSGN